MAIRNVRALGSAEPPNRNHGPVFFPLVLDIVKDSCYVAMAVVAADVVHSFAVDAISPRDIFIDLRYLGFI